MLIYSTLYVGSRLAFALKNAWQTVLFEIFYESRKFERKKSVFFCKKDDIPYCGGKYCWVGTGAGGGGGIYCGWGAFGK